MEILRSPKATNANLSVLRDWYRAPVYLQNLDIEGAWSCFNHRLFSFKLVWVVARGRPFLINQAFLVGYYCLWIWWQKKMAFECVKNERRSKVWEFFLLNKEERKAKCISCSLIIIIRKDGSTNYLIQHLKSKHFKDYKLTKPNKNENTKGQ